MKHKIVLEVDHNLKDGEILQYKDGVVRSIEIHELLPDLNAAKADIRFQEKLAYKILDRVEELERKVKELRGENDE